MFLFCVQPNLFEIFIDNNSLLKFPNILFSATCSYIVKSVKNQHIFQISLEEREVRDVILDHYEMFPGKHNPTPF